MPEFPHSQLDQADNCLKVADATGVAVFVRQAPDFAEDHSDDTVIVVLRGAAAVKAGRDALVAVADLVRDSQ